MTMMPPTRCWPLLGALLLTITASCLHDWDSLEAPEGNGTTTGSGGAPQADVLSLCQTYCRVVNDCAAQDPSCEATCVDALLQCPPAQLASIAECMDTIDDDSCAGSCAGFIGFIPCLTGTFVTCWTPPVTSC